jgi:hypothetical protein
LTRSWFTAWAPCSFHLWWFISLKKKKRGFYVVMWKDGHCFTGKLPSGLDQCLPLRELGGLGIWDMGTQNICLLLRLLHKLHCPIHSAWAQWLHTRSSVATLSGDLHGDHLQVLRTLLPLYQAITTVSLGDGKARSFWSDVWCADEALADVYPALFSHCTKKNANVNEMMDLDLRCCQSSLQSITPCSRRHRTSDCPYSARGTLASTAAPVPTTRSSGPTKW